MFRPALQIILILALSGVAFSAAAQAREARVNEIEVITDAPGVAVIVRGALPDGCTELGEPQQTVERNRILITLPTRRPFGALCTQALVFYEETIPLDVTGLAPGEYEVDVNGITDTFTLERGMTGAQPVRPEVTVAPQPAAGMEVPAFVDSVEIRFDGDQSVNALVEGNLPDGCTELAGYTQVSRQGSIEVSLLTTRPPDAGCTAALEPFSETLPIDVTGLAEGVYSVTVNGVTSPPFVLDRAIPAAETGCASIGEGFALLRHLQDGYCISFPADLATRAAQPGWVEISLPGDTVAPLLTITAEAADGRTLEAIAAESDMSLQETELGGATALTTGMLSESEDIWQAYILHDDRLYSLAANPQSAVLAADVWERIIGSFAFLSQ